MKIPIAAFQRNETATLKAWTANQYVRDYLQLCEKGVENLYEMELLKSYFDRMETFYPAASTSVSYTIGMLYLCITSTPNHNDSFVYYEPYEEYGSAFKNLELVTLYGVTANTLKYYLGLTNNRNSGYASSWTFDPFTGEKKTASDGGPVAVGGYFIRNNPVRTNADTAICGCYESNSTTITYTVTGYNETTGIFSFGVEQGTGSAPIIVPKDWQLAVYFHSSPLATEVEKLVTEEARGVADQISSYFVSR